MSDTLKALVAMMRADIQRARDIGNESVELNLTRYANHLDAALAASASGAGVPVAVSDAITAQNQALSIFLRDTENHDQNARVWMASGKALDDAIAADRAAVVAEAVAQERKRIDAALGHSAYGDDASAEEIGYWSAMDDVRRILSNPAA